MVHIRLHASLWRTQGDFCADLLASLGAPDWHGANLNAIEESLRDRGINAVDPPVTFQPVGVEDLPAELQAYLDCFAEVIRSLAADGIQVAIDLRPRGHPA